MGWKRSAVLGTAAALRTLKGGAKSREASMPKDDSDDATGDVNELFRRISQPELGYHSFDLALQDEEAPTIPQARKAPRKPAEPFVAKPDATAAKPASRGKLLRAWSPEAPAAPEATATEPSAAAGGTDLKAVFSALGKAKPQRSSH